MFRRRFFISYVISLACIVPFHWYVYQLLLNKNKMCYFLKKNIEKT